MTDAARKRSQDPASPFQPEAHIEFRGITKTFRSTNGSRSTTAVDGIDLTIGQGEFVCLVGPSGCGKTTLLQMLAGLVRPDRGEVLLGGEPIVGTSPRQGMVFQEYALFPWMTVRGNVEAGLRYGHVPRRERRARVDALLKAVNLESCRDAFPKELSGGMKQRVAIARAYAPDPDVLLMDEPFGALDVQTKSVLQEDLLATWASTKKTVVFVTHDVDEAVYLSQRVVLLSPSPGRVFADIAIDLDYPRAREVRVSPEFSILRTRIWEMIYRMS